MMRVYLAFLLMIVGQSLTMAGVPSVPPVLSAPVLEADENYGPEATVLTGNVGDNDMDPEGGMLTFTALSSPPSGTFVMQPNGAYTYTPLPEYNGFFNITYQACDPNGNCATSTLELALLFVNDNPVTADDEFFITQNSTFTGSVATNDFDVDIEPIFYTLRTAPAQGSVSIAYTTGNFSYTPPPGFLGTVTWTYFGCDPCGVCSIGTVTIHVLEQNNPPITNDDEGYGAEDEPLTGSVALNDSDPDGNELTFSMVSTTTRGSLVMQPNGTYTFTPNANYHGLEDLTYRACDVFNACTTGTLSIFISSVNDAPVAIADVFNGSEDQAVSGNVGANDFDVDIEPLSYIASGTATGGTFSLSSNGSFLFVPLPNWWGVATARYYAVDPCGFTSELTEVTFNIASVNDLPVAVADQFAGNENEVISGDVSLNDSDIETATSALLYSVATAPVNGNLLMSSNGSFTYTPNANYFGIDAATYNVNDGNGGTASAQIIFEIISVNSVPVIQDDSFSVNEDEVLSADVSINDVLEEGETLIYTLGNPPLNGVVLFNANGTFTYTPNENFNGADSFGYVGTDPFGAADLGVVFITVVPVNDPPVALSDAFSGLEDQVISGTVASNDSDVEPDVLTYEVVIAPTNGSVVLDASGAFVYTPFANYNGEDLFVYSATDEDGAEVEAQVFLTVLSVNDSPIAFADEFTTNEDVGISSSVADNDVDFDGDALNFTLVLGPQNGTIQWNPDGSFNYTPNFNFFGVEVMSYVAADDVANTEVTSFTIQVQSVNDAPVPSDDFVLTLENVPAAGNVSLNDVDIDSPSLLYSVVQTPQTGTFILQPNGAFVYTPALNVFGIQQVTYSVSDGQGGTATALLSIAVQSVNSAPVAVNDDFFMLEDGLLNGSVATNDSDVETSSLNYTVFSTTQNGTLVMQSNGSFVYAPVANFNGIDTFRYIASDAEATDTALVTIYINSVNDLPTIGSDDFTLNEDGVFNGNLATNDADADGNVLSYALVTSTSNGVITLNSAGTFVYTPESNYFGADTFVYSWSDGQGAAGQLMVYINVTAVNDLPVAVNDVFNGSEDTTVTGSVSLNDSDVDNATLVYALLTSTTNGALVLSSNGTFVYTPNANSYGTDVFVYSVTDGAGGTAIGNVEIAIAAINDVPVAVADNFSLLMNGTLNASVATNDSDADNEMLIYSLIGSPNSGSMQFQNDGSFQWVPNINYFGVQTIEYEVCDPQGACASASLSLQVVENNTAPTANADVLVLNEDDTGSFQVLANDVDADGDVLTLTVLTSPAHGVAQLNAQGMLTYTPDTNYFGPDQLIYEVCDPLNECDTALVNIQVVAVNDLPIVQSDAYVINEDETLQANVSGNDSDVETSALVYTLQGSTSSGAIVLSGSGELNYTPNADFNGTVEVNYSACDASGACATASIVIVVDAVNDAPVANDQNFTLFVGESVNGDFSADATDVDNDPLVYSLLAPPAQGVFTVTQEGAFSYQSDVDYTGEVTAIVQVCDGQFCVNASLSFTLNAVNHPPVAAATAMTVCKGTVVEIGLDTLVSDQDEPSASLVLTALSGVGGLLYFNDPSRTIIFELQPTFTGLTTLSYSVCDSGVPSLCAQGTVSIEVLPIDLPVIDSLVVNQVACYGENTGSIVAHVSGAGPFRYWWNGEQGNAVASELSAGSYSLEVTSEAPCGASTSAEVLVSEPSAPLDLNQLFTLYLGDTGGDVMDNLAAIGGNAPYDYAWFGMVSSTDSVFLGSGAAPVSFSFTDDFWYSMTLEVVDSMGCRAIFQPDNIITSVAEVNKNARLSVSPNPGNGWVRLDVELPYGGFTGLEVFNTSGQCVWQQKPQPRGAFWSETFDWSALPPGVYMVKLRGTEWNRSVRYIKH